MSWPIKYEPNLINVLLANAWKLLHQSGPGSSENSLEHNQKWIRSEGYLNVSTKFGIDPLSGLSGNTRKLKSMKGQQTEGWTERRTYKSMDAPIPVVPPTLLAEDKNNYIFIINVEMKWNAVFYAILYQAMLNQAALPKTSLL